MMNTLTDAAAILERYNSMLSEGRLVQSSWHKRDDEGRHLACALGVIGEDISSHRDCPASVMPRWLAQMVPWFFDTQAPEDAFRWGAEFYQELARLSGQVPFSVIHDWHARYTTVLAIKVATTHKRDTAPHVALQKMHAAAHDGQSFTADEWRPVLKNVYANTYGDAYVDAYSNAYSSGNANGNAYAYVNAYANVYVGADVDVYVDAYVDAYANGDAYAYAYDNVSAKAVKCLANGMIDCLKAVQTPTETPTETVQ